MRIYKIAQSNKDKDLLTFKDLIAKLQELPKTMNSQTNHLFELLGENDEIPFKTRMVRNEIVDLIDIYPEWANLIPENLRVLFRGYTFTRAWK